MTKNIIFLSLQFVILCFHIQAEAGIFDWITGKKAPKGYPFRLENAPTAKNSAYSWKIKKAQWGPTEELAYKEFILRIATAVENRQCETVHQCLSNPQINSYRHSDPESYQYYADCADFPYFLRAYFSWKNQLPFTFSSQMQLVDVPGNEIQDIRYSQLGNEVLERTQALSAGNGKYADAAWVLSNLSSKVSSSMFRVHFAYQPERFPDFYPIQISREALVPGSILYDPNGHVAVVYKISSDGRVYYIDAHPDNTLSTGFFSRKYARSFEGLGAGFKRFRPIKLINYSVDAAGFLVGGEIVASKNSESPSFSAEQFYGSNYRSNGNRSWNDARFDVAGIGYDYYDWVKARLSLSGAKVAPLHEMRLMVNDLCNMLKDRVTAVNIAIKAGIHLRPHPDRLPMNIYGSDGDWETYSSPSRDSGIKIIFKDLLDQTKSYVARHMAHDPSIEYAGSNLLWDLLTVYQQESQACQFSYTNSVGTEVPLNLELVRQRLFKISFDPYNCPELRWGAEDRREMVTCQDNDEKLYWYSQQQYLRNQLERRYDIRMDYRAQELSEIRPGVGVVSAPDTNIIRFLSTALQTARLFPE